MHKRKLSIFILMFHDCYAYIYIVIFKKKCKKIVDRATPEGTVRALDLIVLIYKQFYNLKCLKIALCRVTFSSFWMSVFQKVQIMQSTKISCFLAIWAWESTCNIQGWYIVSCDCDPSINALCHIDKCKLTIKPTESSFHAVIINFCTKQRTETVRISDVTFHYIDFDDVVFTVRNQVVIFQNHTRHWAIQHYHFRFFMVKVLYHTQSTTSKPDCSNLSLLREMIKLF